MSKTVNLLLVDDEKEFAQAFKKRLEHRGFQVRVAFSKEDALRIAEKNIIEAAILDVMLPDGDGHELFEQIVAIHPECIAVMLTGYGDIDKAFRLGQKGLCGYFSKPCDIDEIEQSLRKALSGDS